ncbi:MAG: DMT family transporter [Pseudomonadota bacterium]|nr:DMT family transporter [Pseudomonadota bacterium]
MSFLTSRYFAHALLMLTAFIWGVSFVFQTTGMKDVGAMGFQFYRFLAGGLALLPIALWEYRKNPFWKQQEHISRKHILWGGLGLGVFMFAGSSLQQIALHTTSVANAAYLTTLYVPLVPIFGLFLFGIHLPWMRWLAVLVFMIGSWLMTGTNLNSITFGDWLVVSSAVFWALHIMLVGALVRLTKMPFQLAFVQTMLTALFSFVVFVVIDRIDLMLAYAVLPDILFAGVLSIAVGFTLQLVAQQNCSSSAAAILLSLEGVFAALAGWVLLEQDMTGLAIIGAGFIMVAILLVELTPVRHAR